MKVLVIPRVDTDAQLGQLYSKVKNKGVAVYFPESKVDLFRKLIKANIIHLHWIEYFVRSRNILLTFLKAPIFVSGLLLLKLLGKKLVITLHNIKPHESFYPRVEFVGFKLSLNLANAIIVHNNYTKGMANKVYGIAGGKVTLIPHGNYISYYQNYITREEARARLGVSKNRFVLLFFGMIRPYKGLEDLIDVLKSILTYDEDLLVMIVGECSGQYLKEPLYRFSNDFPRNCIIKLQHIPDEEVQLYMNACDIGILPYKEITTSGSLLLYMSFGKPVLVPQLEPIRETLGDLGVYYDPQKKGSLESAIIGSRHLDLATISGKMFEKASEYNWDEIADRTARVYISIL